MLELLAEIKFTDEKMIRKLIKRQVLGNIFIDIGKRLIYGLVFRDIFGKQRRFFIVAAAQKDEKLQQIGSGCPSVPDRYEDTDFSAESGLRRPGGSGGNLLRRRLKNRL